MAVNLPYPNMDYVPLDILTAAEMNQMVANDQYLANMWGLTDTNGIILARHLSGEFSLSTTEQDTGKKIGGKPIYRKTFGATALAVTTGVSDLLLLSGVDSLINSFGSWGHFGNQKMAINAYATPSIFSYLVLRGGQVFFSYSGDSTFTSTGYDITVEYTKN